MSNIVPIDTQVPAHLANKINQPSVLGDSLGGGIGGGADFPRISIKGSRFRIVEGGVESVLDATSLEVVIVGANPKLSKSWYATAWTPDADASAPDCYTLDGVSPHPDSAQPQNDLCASCPQNAWGSRVTQQGTKVKACADQKRLAVVAADDPEGGIYLLQVTPAALKGLNQYQKELSMRGIAPEIVKTVIAFDTQASFPKLKFGFGGFITEEIQKAVDPLFGSEKVLEITGEADVGAVALPAAAPAEEAAPPAAEAAPAQAQEPVAEPAAPAAAEKKQTGFGAATTTAPAETAAAPAATPPAETAAAPAAEEPAAAPAAPADASTGALADEITALMKEVADDA